MHRRSFLKGAAALAAAPNLPALPASAAVPLVQTVSAEALARGAICANTITVSGMPRSFMYAGADYLLSKCRHG